MPAIDTSALGVLIPMLIGLWIIVTIPVYISAKIVTGGRARFTRALGATVLGPLAYAGVLFATTMVAGSFIGMPLTFLSALLALAAWLWIFKLSFKTGWLTTIGIAVLAVIVFVVSGFLILLAIAVLVPGAPPHAMPMPLQPV